ncbi:MAG: hypothetical protein A2020_07065 [Lentisphaerae bacterium GWF2_45_14]|nr:MAG: hypothetical protein A2020_07065 [Lentisphaerae bacterium GWF2_45_14]
MGLVRISILTDNYATAYPFEACQGFSALIETENLNAIFDTGPNNMFSANAMKMQIELFGADAIILSHGHYDHTGGIEKALAVAPRATLYLSRKAMDEKFSRKNGRFKNVGIPERAKNTISLAELENRVEFIEASKDISDAITLFSIPGGRTQFYENWPFTTIAENGNEMSDRFEDELSMLISGKESSCLIAGCGHNGIDEMCKYAEKISGKPVSHIIGGSHTKEAPFPEIVKISRFFETRDTMLHLGHCTGIEGYCALSSALPGKLRPLGTGLQIELDIR